MPKKNRSSFRITRFILLKFPSIFRFLARFRKPARRLLIIKTDAIGDYILFRNYLELLRRSEKFKDYQITLLGNELWKDIALKYDIHFVDDFLFTVPGALYYSPLTTLKLGWQLFKNNYQIVLQPSSTRLLTTDGLAALTAAKQIIGFESDNEGILQRYKLKTDKFYTLKLVLPKNINFEFERSRYFFESILNQPVTISGPHIPTESSYTQGIIIFPGAGISKRGCGPENFLELIKLIRQHTSQPVYLAGGPAEMQIGDYLTENLPPGSIDNLIGKTSLPQLVDLIANAALVIANETSAIHIAAATQTKSICILGGGHFGRFAPYPEYMQSRPVCIYEKMDCYYCNWNCIYKTAEKEPYPCISKISLENVWREVLPLFS